MKKFFAAFNSKPAIGDRQQRRPAASSARRHRSLQKR
jgi:hypothetical protein